MKSYVNDLESEAVDTLQAELSGPLELAKRTYNLIAGVLEAERELPEDGGQARQVAVGLMGRLARDLNAVVLLAEHGYPMQALSLAACAYEVGMTIPYIWNDKVRAQKWVNHNDASPLWGAKDLTLGAFKNMGITDAVKLTAKVKNVYDNVYRVLARAKHANPNAERFSWGDADSPNGPMLSQRGSALAETALLNTIRSAIIACFGFIYAHLPAEAQNPLLRQQEEIDCECAALTELHNKRTDLD